MQAINASANAKVYLASDFHLGVPDRSSSHEREQRLVHWLDHISEDAGALILLGDLFDFWFEYRKVVPKGFTRLLGTLARMSDKGLPIYIFTGNHDLWMKDYLSQEIGATVFHQPQWFEINGQLCYLAHGDGLGPGDHGYKMLKKVFTNKLAQWLFRWIHPDIGIRMANFFSGVSRNSQDSTAEGQFLGEDQEYLVQHVKNLMAHYTATYYIFGHRHYPMKYSLGSEVCYVNLGDWLNHDTYGVHDGQELLLKTFEQPHLDKNSF